MPGTLLDESVWRCFEKSESAPSEGCTEIITSLDRYAILATVVPKVCQPNAGIAQE